MWQGRSIRLESEGRISRYLAMLRTCSMMSRGWQARPLPQAVLTPALRRTGKRSILIVK